MSALAGTQRRQADVLSEWLLPAGVGLVAVGAALTALQIAQGYPTATPVLLVAAAAGLALVRRPAWVLPAFFALVWSSLHSLAMNGVSPVDVGFVVLMAVAAVRAARDPAGAAPALRIAALLALGVVAPGLIAGATGGALSDAVLEIGFLLVAALCVTTVADAQRVAVALAVVGGVLGAGAAWSVLVGPFGPFVVVGEESLRTGATVARAAGPFGEPNFFALSIAATAPFALLAAAAPPPRRLLGIACIVAIAAGVLATGSRGALLTLGITILAFGAMAGRSWARTAAIASVAAVLALLPLFALQSAASQERSTAGRVTEGAIAIGMFADHPVTGVGAGVYPTLYRDYAREIGNDERTNRAAHSLPLQILAEQGIAGAAAWLVAGAATVAVARAAGLWSTLLGRAVCLAPLSYLVGSLFLHGSQLRLLYLLAGLVLALSAALVRQEQPA